MNQFQVKRIQQAAQGRCGLIDLLAENNINKDFDDTELLLPNIEGHLFTAAQCLAHEINGDTEDLHEYEFVRKLDKSKSTRSQLGGVDNV